MSLKNSKTTCSYINWDEMMNLILKLERDEEYRFSLLMAIGSFTGLRISDILNLKWADLIGQEHITVIEKKTKKERRIKINQDLSELSNRIYNMYSKPALKEYVFINRYGIKPINIQYVNVRIKQILAQYKVKTDNPSTHTLRKTFGRRIWEINNCSERSLILLSEIFNHSNIQITKRYLGIREQEIFDVYDSLSL